MVSTGFIIVTIVLAILAVVIALSWNLGHIAGYQDALEEQHYETERQMHGNYDG